MTLIVSLGLLLWGLPGHDVLVIGLMVGILNVIPYVGPTIGIALGIFIGVTGGYPDMSGSITAIKIAGTILFAQGIDNFVLQPVLYSNRAKAHPLEIFLVILIAGSLAGVLGMLLAIPAYNVIRVFAKEFSTISASYKNLPKRFSGNFLKRVNLLICRGHSFRQRVQLMGNSTHKLQVCCMLSPRHPYESVPHRQRKRFRGSRIRHWFMIRRSKTH